MAFLPWRYGWNPFRELERLQGEMDRVVDWPGWGKLAGRVEFPATNIQTTADDVIVTMSLPGVSREDLDLAVTGDTVTIKGERKPREGVEAESYHIREREFGPFARSIALPDPVDPDKAEATHAHGILTVRLPKSEAAKPKRITVTTE